MTDWQMPDMDGFEVLRRLADELGYPDLETMLVAVTERNLEPDQVVEQLIADGLSPSLETRVMLEPFGEAMYHFVKAVAQQHNSSVNLSTSAEGGLMVTVDFPNRTFC